MPSIKLQSAKGIKLNLNKITGTKRKQQPSTTDDDELPFHKIPATDILREPIKPLYYTPSEPSVYKIPTLQLFTYPEFVRLPTPKQLAVKEEQKKRKEEKKAIAEQKAIEAAKEQAEAVNRRLAKQELAQKAAVEKKRKQVEKEQRAQEADETAWWNQPDLPQREDDGEGEEEQEEGGVNPWELPDVSAVTKAKARAPVAPVERLGKIVMKEGETRPVPTFMLPTKSQQIATHNPFKRRK